MEATKKTSTTKAALLVLAALSMLLSGLFVATASRSDASPPPACPDGFSLTQDGKNCFQAAVITSTDNPNSCDAGQLTPDGTKCYVAARVLPQEGSTLCPKGYSPDDSLGGMCARFAPASQRDPGCPDGARGAAAGCYILVAKGPAGTNTCADGATLSGTSCVLTGDAPIPGKGTCQVSDRVQTNAAGECFEILPFNVSAGSCDTFPMYELAGGVCKWVFPGANLDGSADFAGCPAASGGTLHTFSNGHTKGGWCELAAATDQSCPVSADITPVANGCKRSVALKKGDPVCPQAGYSVVGTKCIRFTNSSPVAASCPTGSAPDSIGQCRKPVADAAGEYYCKDAAAAVNGKSCVWTAGFEAVASPTLYKCDAGTRTVIGAGATQQVICLLGDSKPNTNTGPSCTQGVLSTDSAYCVVPRIDTAPAAAATAPVPSFTG